MKVQSCCSRFTLVICWPGWSELDPTIVRSYGFGVELQVQSLNHDTSNSNQSHKTKSNEPSGSFIAVDEWIKNSITLHGLSRIHVVFFCDS